MDWVLRKLLNPRWVGWFTSQHDGLLPAKIMPGHEWVALLYWTLPDFRDPLRPPGTGWEFRPGKKMRMLEPPDLELAVLNRAFRRREMDEDSRGGYSALETAIKRERAERRRLRKLGRELGYKFTYLERLALLWPDGLPEIRHVPPALRELDREHEARILKVRAEPLELDPYLSDGAGLVHERDSLIRRMYWIEGRDIPCIASRAVIGEREIRRILNVEAVRPALIRLLAEHGTQRAVAHALGVNQSSVSRAICATDTAHYDGNAELLDDYVTALVSRVLAYDLLNPSRKRARRC